MDEFDYWRLADTFSLVDAAALICGIPPSEIRKDELDGTIYFYFSSPEKTPQGYKLNNSFFAVLKTLKNAVLTKTLPVSRDAYLFNNLPLPQGPELNLEETLVGLKDLRNWLTSRGFKTGFFFPEGETADYLTKEHPKYAPKLAACVRAWQYAIKLPDNGKTPKQNIDKWLREHASEFGMTDPDGRPIESAIEQCSKVANWETKGGAPKTP